MDPRPINPPTAARGAIVGTTLAEVVTANADGTVDVRLSRSRGGKGAVAVVAGLDLDVGDRVLITLIDGDPNTPIITNKV